MIDRFEECRVEVDDKVAVAVVAVAVVVELLDGPGAGAAEGVEMVAEGLWESAVGGLRQYNEGVFLDNS